MEWFCASCESSARFFLFFSSSGAVIRLHRTIPGRRCPSSITCARRKQFELPRRGGSQTWSGEVSCREVSTVTGDTKYFFLALDEKGDIVGGSGSPDWPHLATIVGKLDDGAQAIAGEEVPVRCHDVADCPPDFPGCGSPSGDTDPTAVENLDVAIRAVTQRYRVATRRL